jgi:predicted metal-binding membrane protein
VADTALESALKRDRWITAGALGLAVLLCWAWIVPMARDMYGPMTGPAAWMMTGHWGATHLLLLLAMWVVMMVGMMLPSAAPTLLLYAAVLRKSMPDANAPLLVYAFGAGYLLIWSLFSIAATVLQRVLSEMLVLSPMMELQNRTWAGALLALAGAYQLTPLKSTCLQHCRSPAMFISQHWRADPPGALHMGLTHGLYCLGCCWALMLLLFVGGVMNLWVIAAITLFVLAEKVAPRGAQGGRLSGVLLILLGLWTAIAPLQ